jgi:hypothetical protein
MPMQNKILSLVHKVGTISFFVDLITLDETTEQGFVLSRGKAQPVRQSIQARPIGVNKGVYTL